MACLSNGHRKIKMLLRVLLLNRKGATSFDELKTIDGHRYEKFFDATKAAGVLMTTIFSGKKLLTFKRQRLFFFSCLLCHYKISNANTLWNEVSGVYKRAIYSVYLFRHWRPHGRFRQTPSRLLNYEEHSAKGGAQYETLNEEQKTTADAILAAVDRQDNRCIFVDGLGGTGKTYLYNTIYNTVRIFCLKAGPSTLPSNILYQTKTDRRLLKVSYGEADEADSRIMLPLDRICEGEPGANILKDWPVFA
ncbi:unnamed protein product [Heligmosomoides polygyrus]|uniref:ATP-dependent DNA helicase n=1 Tax=Heligmosomoides polygyrus TaxID=6339 RepID=A0A183GVE5_HELPZ|nr:unnamed protein product [Heligmosomoides polygyrus]